MAVGNAAVEVWLGVGVLGSTVIAGVGVADPMGLPVGLGPGVTAGLAVCLGVTLGLGDGGDNDVAPTAAARSSRPACQSEPVPEIRFAVLSKHASADRAVRDRSGT